MAHTDRCVGGADLSLKDMMSSVVAAEHVIDAVLDKVAHIKYMEELEAKVRPFVINYTTLQGTKCLEALEVRHDYKLDDCYLAQDIQDEDCEEPKNLGHDNW